MKIRSRHKIRRPLAFYSTGLFRICFLVMFLCALIIYFAFFTNKFLLKEYIIEGNEKISATELREIALVQASGQGILPKNNIWTSPDRQIISMIKAKFPIIKEVKVRKKLPSTLIISVSERQPKALWCGCAMPDNLAVQNYSTSSASSTVPVFSDFLSFYYSQNCDNPDNLNCFLVDEDGIMFQNSHEFDFRLMAPERELKLGANVIAREQILAILKIRETINQKIGQLADEAYIFSAAQYALRLDGRWWAYFNPKKDIEWQANSLKAVLENKISESMRQTLKYVDLRFENISIYQSNSENEEE